ncbi:hypothetical protein CRENBAI_011687 [Crenichthys baileyi]|uniref:TLC domain-containing protein n=1 Tax=Crenichthys baileyi TaxID=28760 RepID=A0AAV9SBS9_9TELE
MASSAFWLITSSCMDVMEDRHWLTESYILFATPYFAYDVFAMFLCYWYKLQVKGHEEAGPDGRSLQAAVSGFLHREVLMVLHHVFMVAFCFPASLSVVNWAQLHVALEPPGTYAKYYTYPEGTHHVSK